MTKKTIKLLTLKEYFTLLGILVSDSVLKGIKSAEDVRLVLDAYSYQVFKRNQVDDYAEFVIDEAAMEHAAELPDNTEGFDLSTSFSSKYFLYEPCDVSEAFENNDNVGYIKEINAFVELPY